MQGNQTEESIIQALDKIYQHIDFFDVVVIIRGGGATADLSAFDSYRLAYYCTQFPLPIITGIGHQRDESVLDLVAHTSLKTPTAVAEYLIDILAESDDFLNDAQSVIVHYTKEMISHKRSEIKLLSYQIQSGVLQSLSAEKQSFSKVADRITLSTKAFLKSKRYELSAFEKNITLLSPEYILKKGYSITSKNGKIIKTSSDLQIGDVIETRFAEGKTTSTVADI